MADIPQCGHDLLQRVEGCKLVAYPDERGIPTIGFGHTAGVQLGDTCTQEQANAWLAEDCAWAWTAVQAHVVVPLSDNQAGALLSFVYNLGEPAFMKSSLLSQLNTGCYTCVPGQMMKWIWETKKDGSRAISRGLENRRHAESQLWTGNQSTEV